MMEFELEPVDTLFFRDARPMQAGAGSGGHGANWPLPTVLHSALRTALIRQSGAAAIPTLNVKGRRQRKNKKGPRQISFVTRDYESLRTLGPFPVCSERMYFPVPCDVVLTETGRCYVLSPLENAPGGNNLPRHWLRPVTGVIRVGKKSPPPWIPSADFARLLVASGEIDLDLGCNHSPLWQVEQRIGIGIDLETGAAATGQFYSAEHLRLINGTRLWVTAQLSPSDTALEKGLPDLNGVAGGYLTLGGESRMCRLLPTSQQLHIPQQAASGSHYLKWVLLTPALFSGGWLPNWVESDSGHVKLKKGSTSRAKGESRLAWRERVRKLPQIDARLVAVCCKKPLPFSGWKLAADGEDAGRGAPKATRLAVPAGSVYYFETGGEKDSNALVTALHGRRRSDYLGEKGMGVGLCGLWQPFRPELVQ